MTVESAARKFTPIALKSLPPEPTVSVLITCFNYGAFVGQAIDSALEQTYPPAEIIVSDDASHDNSCEVVESYISRGHNVRLLRNPHGGMAAGVDRIVMLLCGTTNLREISLFPMNQQAVDLLMGAPSEVAPKQLKELHIRLNLPDKG